MVLILDGGPEYVLRETGDSFFVLHYIDIHIASEIFFFSTVFHYNLRNLYWFRVTQNMLCTHEGE